MLKKFFDYNEKTGGLLERYYNQFDRIDDLKEALINEDYFVGYDDRTIEELEEDQRVIENKAAMIYPAFDIHAFCENFKQSGDRVMECTEKIEHNKTMKARILMNIIETLDDISKR